MNVFMIVVLLIFIANIVIGYRRGFVKIVASMSAVIVAVILAALLAPFVSKFLLKVIPIESKMKEKCTEMVMPNENEDASREEQMTMIENAKMPNTFKQLLHANNNKEIYKALGVTQFGDYIAGYIAKLIANVISALLVFLIALILTKIAIRSLGIIDKLPMIGSINHIIGGVCGLITGLVAIWLLFVIITLLYGTSFGQSCFAQIEENGFLKMLYNHNPLIRFITKFRG